MRDLSFHRPQSRQGFQYLSFVPRQHRYLVLLSIGFNLINVFISIVSYPNLQKVIPLFYSQPAEQQLVAKQAIFILPIFATVVNAIHLILIALARNTDQMILRLLVLCTLIMQSLALAILIRTILIIS